MMPISPFKQRSALDMLAELRADYRDLARFRKPNCGFPDPKPVSPEEREHLRWEELEQERIDNQRQMEFERRLHVVIQAFVMEAVEPWQKAFTDAQLRSGTMQWPLK